MSTWSDKVIVIVGASGVFGSTLARTLVAKGADVRLVARHVDKIPSDLAALPAVSADITHREDLAAAVVEISLGRPVDGIVNCAGVVAFGSLAEVPEGITRTLFATNAQGTINVLTLATDSVADGGFIASFSGVAADMVIAGMGAYCASKAAGATAMSVAAKELRSRKIAVLDIRAPHTETGLVDRALFGTAPKMPIGLTPQAVIDRVLLALETGEKDLPADAFAS